LAFSNQLRGISWPTTFKIVDIDKFNSDSKPRTWLYTYSIIIRATNRNNDIMAAYLPVMMSRQALNWLEGLQPGSINSWQDLYMAFVNHIQASYLGPKTKWDLGSVTQQPNESLHDYNKRYFANCNKIVEVDDRDVIHYFHQELHNIELWRKMFEGNPKTVSEMMMVVNKHIDMEDAEEVHHHHKDQRNSDDHPKPHHEITSATTVALPGKTPTRR
jgi:hypothetical protein